MKIAIIPEVGDQYKVKKPGKGILDFGFCFLNPHGGTGMSNWEHDEKFKGDAIVEITKVWYDDEVGYRCWAKASNQEVKDYLLKVADTKELKQFGYQRIFVSEHDIEIIK